MRSFGRPPDAESCSYVDYDSTEMYSQVIGLIKGESATAIAIKFGGSTKDFLRAAYLGQRLS